MRSTRRSLLSVLMAVALAALAYVLIVNGLRNPLSSASTSYHAVFTDVSGLRPGADVRRQGVQVGKVTSIEVSRAGNTNVAEVVLELPREERVTTATHLTVKFQNLTGSRYVDIRDQDPQDVPNPLPISTVPVTQTTGSFDITTIFRGLAPVLSTLEPADVNNLTEKLSIFLDGDGAGAADLLDSIRSIAGRATDQQQTLSALVANISEFAKGVQGNSERLFRIVTMFDTVVDRTMAVRDQIGLSAQYGPNFVASVNRLLWVAGARGGDNIDAKFDVMRANLYRIPEFFERLPGFYGGLKPLMNDPSSDLHCTNGTFVAPAMVKVFLGGEQVVLCNR